METTFLSKDLENTRIPITEVIRRNQNQGVK